MDSASQNGGAGASNSSDFVRKLYKMLEDPSYSTVVRWGDDGDSFVVLENERFTKSILPKHFKHSNFASFVRQLNKYDFHKVRHNNEEGGGSPYGPGAWEFKHPDFRANNKDALDNIRRKAPAPRKPNANLEESMPTQQMDLVNSQLVATQQQLRHLEDRYQELSMHHGMLLQELIGVQKTVINHEHVMQNVMTFLQSVDAKHRRDSRVGGPFAQQNGATVPEIPPEEDLPASPLANASKLMEEIASQQLNFKNLEHMNQMHSRTLANSSPPPESRRGPNSAASSSSMAYAKLNDLDNMVYPIGQTTGIDPMYSEHVHNIPYPMPSKESQPDPRATFADNRKKSTQVDPGWIRSPHILLVEDDQTCRRIGSKFLYSFHCQIDSALDGLEAVNKINEGHRYDLILMDIIMPNLDGVSACHLIRQVDQTPIIAMTSNIRSDDISMYFNHGMNDVLPKPFTKDGLLIMLEKHLGHMKKLPDGLDMPSAGTSIHPGTHSIKDETSPGQSPSTVSNWASPNQFSGISPAGSGQFAPNVNTTFIEQNNNLAHQQNLAYTSPTTPISAGPRIQGHRRQVSEMGVDEIGNDPKRARMYATTNAAMNQMRRA